MWGCEIRLFFNKKNIVTLIIGMLICICFFAMKYEKKYSDYKSDRLDEIEVENRQIDIWIDYYKSELESNMSYKIAKQSMPFRMELEGDSQEAILYNLWKDYEQKNMLTKRNLQSDKYDEAKIGEYDIEFDYKLGQVKNVGSLIDYTKLFRNHYDDWQKRMVLHKKYKDENIVEPSVKIKPTGSYVVSDMISGTNPILVTVLLYVFLINFEIYPSEYEREMNVQLKILPSNTYYFVLRRIMIRSICSVFEVMLCFIELFVLGTIKYGSGLESFEIVKLREGYIAVSIRILLLKELLYLVLLIMFFTTLTLFISMWQKDVMNSFVVISILLMCAIMSIGEKISKCNPFVTLRISEMSHGYGKIGLLKSGGYLVLWSVIICMIMMLLYEKRED
ncbi:hypothetical protein [Butyrivibrio sp. NC3005]|uniref:hypothetical protein n=1 Tax=Butyrivibrio sp. NC3005 TaxID=1280685 RepID=UPI00040510DE|nr:hypothetical protein [Butyrivibrio sp. NC3005]